MNSNALVIAFGNGNHNSYQEYMVYIHVFWFDENWLQLISETKENWLKFNAIIFE